MSHRCLMISLGFPKIGSKYSNSANCNNIHQETIPSSHGATTKHDPCRLIITDKRCCITKVNFRRKSWEKRQENNHIRQTIIDYFKCFALARERSKHSCTLSVRETCS